MYYEAMSRNAATMDVFHAVADPTRRRILDLLVEGERAVLDLVSSFEISQPSISEHLRILREVGLVSVRKSGRQRLYSLSPIYLRKIAGWLASYHRFWDKRLDRLGAYLEQEADEAVTTTHIRSQMTMEID